MLGVSPEAKHTEGRGKADIQMEKDRKGGTNGMLLLTKLSLPRHQVTLSQIPPSQKEMQGVEDTPSLQARPCADFKLIVDLYGPNDILHWPVEPIFLRFG
jgi:hypothetical protein